LLPLDKSEERLRLLTAQQTRARDADMSEHLELELRNIEHALHAALVRQLRVISLMALLLGVAGFFVGHFVADEQSRAGLSPLEQQVAELQKELADVQGRCRRQETAHAQALVALNQLDALRKDDAARDAAAINALLTDISQRRAMTLRDLDAHVAQRITIPPEAVTGAINRFVDEHMLQLDRALAIVERRMDDRAIAASRAPLPPIDHAEPVIAPPMVVQMPQATSTPGSLSSPALASTAERPADSHYFNQPASTPAPAPTSAPAKKGYLFFSRSQPQKMDPVRVSDSESIPLPPR